MDARRKEINPRHAGHGQLKTHGRDDQRVANQHHHGGKGQRRRAVVFLIQQQRRQHQSAHNARAADRRGKARHRRKKQQRWKTHKGSQEPLPESNGSKQSEQNRHMQSGNSRHMANPADFQAGIYRITQACGITQQKRPGKGSGILRNAGLQNCLNPVPQPRRDIPPRRVCMGRNGNLVHLIRQQENAVARVIGSVLLRRGGAETELAGDGVPGFQRFVQVQICPKAVGLPFQLHHAVHADTVCRLVAVVRHPDDCVCRFSVHRPGSAQIKAVIQGKPAHSHGKAKKNRGNSPEQGELSPRNRRQKRQHPSRDCQSNPRTSRENIRAQAAGRAEAQRKPYQFTHPAASLSLEKAPPLRQRLSYYFNLETT